MSQEGAVTRPYQQFLDQSTKPTFAALSEVIIGAANSVSDGNGGPLVSAAFEKLRDQLFLSPRLTQWQFNSDKTNRGFWLKSKDQTATVTVREDKVILSTPDNDNPRYPFNYDVVVGLPAATLFKSIQDAQAIVQSHISATDEGEDFFKPGSEEPYYESAGLDSALEETHAEPLGEDDAELIEEVCEEATPKKPLRVVAGQEQPVVYEDEEDLDAQIKQVVKEAEALKEEIEQSYSAKTNRKNAVTDGVQCEYCGNLNRDSYKGHCPQCPEVPAPRIVEKATNDVMIMAALGRGITSRLKSLQGRVLTIIDGTFSDKTQREAVKQMINKEFRREITKAGE